MATDYNEYYKEYKRGLGEPTKEFVAFFQSLGEGDAKVLDVGCGQGRDALFIAKLGYHVTAIDFSPIGISDLKNDAAIDNLNIETHVIDIRNYTTEDVFDVLVIDRTLHMLKDEEQVCVFNTLLKATKSGAYVLIADERRNIPALKACLTDSQWDWTITLEKKGFLFVELN